MDKETIIQRLEALARYYDMVDLQTGRNKSWKGTAAAMASFARNLIEEIQETPENLAAREAFQEMVDEYHSFPDDEAWAACRFLASESLAIAETLESAGFSSVASYLRDAADLYGIGEQAENPDWFAIGDAMIALIIVGWGFLVWPE